MDQALYPHEYLAEMLVPEYPNVYVLGCFAKYATIYSQQVRAINLVDSLCRTGQMASGTKVAIVGAAASGLTAAVAAALRGATVEVFEKEGVLFPIQRNPGRRFLHPHVYDWPVGEILDSDAGLPILNWRADDASVVFATLERQWEKARSQLGIAPVWTNRELTGVEVRDRKPLLIFKSEGKFQFDVAILAVGFGAEIDRADLQRYWQSDLIDATLTGSTVMVSGAGDGALTDIMRLCIQDFHHDEIVARFLEYDDVAGPLKTLLRSKEKVKVEEVFGRVCEKTSLNFGPKIKFREGMKVYLNAPGDYLESAQTAILNRFIVYLLEKEKRFERKGGDLKYPIPVQTTIGGKSSFVVDLDSKEKPEQVVCQRLLIRHGPERLEGDKTMPKHWAALDHVWKVCTPLRERWKAKAAGHRPHHNPAVRAGGLRSRQSAPRGPAEDHPACDWCQAALLHSRFVIG